MRLAYRLLLSSLVVTISLTVTVAWVLERQLHGQIDTATIDELAREARFVASEWRTDSGAMALAHSAGQSLGHRVTLIRSDGVVRGDSEFDSLGVAQLENHSTRPEVIVARSGRTGFSRRTSPSQGDAEVYVAVPATLGIARVSESTSAADAVFEEALRDVVGAGVIAVIVALVLTLLFARSVSRPVIELRDIARAIANGDLTRRPAMSAPGEVGDLANALHRVSDQLSVRLGALRDDEVLLSAVIESLSEGVLAVSSRQIVLRINAAGRMMLQVHEPTPFSIDLIPRERTLRDVLSGALLGHATDGEEAEINGRSLVIAARPLSTGGAVLTLSDLTTRRRLESVRRDFVANVSHELRTPLTVIGGFAETLADGPVPDADRARFASLIVSNTNRMQRIVDELLDLSRIESGGWIPRPIDVDVTEIASEAIASYVAAARERNTVLTVSIAPEARHAYADETALRQIIRNLVENAIRHTANGTVEVFSRIDASGLTWIGVRDSGSGIAPEHIGRIFERFYRPDAARSRDSGGTGLGLAIVKHLAEAHGGQVRAESTLGYGTTISISFPAGKSRS